MDVVDITNLDVKNMSKPLKKPTYPTSYSLSKELLEAENELTVLEKKINLGNDLLVKVNAPVLIEKLKKQKEEFEVKKNNLNILVEKLKLISNSIKDFTLFFIFIRRFYTLAIQKENFENASKNISSKLITNLKSEEENLYNEYIDGNCFSNVRLVLSFEPYESYFKEYAKNFFENIQHSNDPYVNSLLMLIAIFYECTYFHTDNFNLTDLKFFLSKNIPINICLPNSNYELAALRCFFFYELLFEFLKLKPVKNNFDHLKKAVILDLKIVNYKANTKDCLLFGLNDLQKALQKINKKYNEYLERKAIEDKQADVNHALIFYKILEGEIQAINKKTKDLIDNKYIKLKKMQRLLVIIVNESHLPKFLEVFSAKIGNDFLVNAIGKPDDIETNKESLNYLFHAICRDEFYTPLNQRITSFINKQIGTYSKDDVSILDNIEFEDLIEFSFYYLFTLLYTDFNASLVGFNNKLLYTEMVTFNVFINFKLQSLEVLEKTKNIRIKKFIEKTFKNVTEYNQHKENILEEIKLNLETMQDIKRILSDTKTLETSLLPKLVTSSVPMPEKTLLVDSLKSLEQKHKICELEYQKIQKHKFINKPKSEKISKINETNHRENLKIDYDKSIDTLSEILCCLSENLTESLKHIKGNTQDISRSRQKFFSAMGQISASILKLSLILSVLENADKIEDLTKMSLLKLLEIAKERIIKNDFMDKKDYEKKLAELQKLYVNSCSLIDDLINQVNPILIEYKNFNCEAQELLTILSISFAEETSSSLSFFKPTTKKVKSKIKEKKSFDHDYLKEKFYLLKKILRIIKCGADDQLIEIYALVIEADKYKNALSLFNKIHLLNKSSDKILRAKKIPRAKFKEANSVIAVKEIENLHSVELEEATERLISMNSLNEDSIQSINPSISCEDSDVADLEKINQKNNLLDSTTNVNPLAAGVYSENDNKNSIMDLEEWKNNFEAWKYEKKFQLYELFNIIENSTLSILQNGAHAFLKILAYYHQEIIGKKSDLMRLKDKKCFLNSDTIATLRKFLIANEQWLDETLNRMNACIGRVHQSIHNNENLKEISLRALLTEYFKISISYNNSLKNLMNEEEKLSRFHINFTKQIFPASSLEQMEETGNIPDFSKQVDKVNQLKLTMELEYKNKQEIIYKLEMIAPDWLNYVKLIDPLYEDNTAENVINPEPPIQAAHVVPLEVASYGPSKVNISTPPAFYYLHPPSAVYISDVMIQPGVKPNNQIFYSM